ncbi:MAG: hypothetical protein CAF45_008125 [Nitrospira sp. CG24E]|nr:MAG: hypothetical protein CAF45_008125 [Nitrospira sp. CG24E]
MASIASPSSPLTAETIRSVIDAMPVQGRIMLKLILLQYFDITDEEILYIVTDRPDPRCVAGTKPTNTTMTKESITVVTDRRNQYRRQVRLKRERTWLQCDCLRKLAQLRESFADRAHSLLAERFAVPAERLETLRASARTMLPRPAIRLLEERWDADEISADDYQQQWLSVEFQTQLRMAEKYRKRLDLAERERQSAISSPLQDHEIGHVWGIPAGSLAARKVKYLTQYLQALQTSLQSSAAATTTAPLDLWKETFSVLAAQPIERSLSTYDGLEKTESALIDKLTALVWGNLAEEIEVKFWTSLVFGASSNAMHSEITRNLFGLQRLATILNDMDRSPEAVDEELLKRSAPTPKPDAGLLESTTEPPTKELSEMQIQILNSMRGEDVSGRPSDKW